MKRSLPLCPAGGKSRTEGADSVVLSAKEIFGLAARVFSAAEMPVGCVGAAAEAVELVDYLSGEGLALLDRCKEGLLGKQWAPPQIIFEAPGSALCDVQGESLLFAGPAIAEWAAAMAYEEGTAAIAVLNCDHVDFLGSVASRIAGRGLSCVAVWAGRTPNDGRSRALRTVALRDRQHWVLGFSEESTCPAFLGDLSDALYADSETGLRTQLDTLRRRAHDWLLTGEVRQDFASVRSASRTETNFCFIMTAESVEHVHLASARTLASKLLAEGTGKSSILDAEELAKAKRSVRKHGRPLDRATWESLMTFAERALIPTSERSRAGAG